jgi:hypothetical protein
MNDEIHSDPCPTAVYDGDDDDDVDNEDAIDHNAINVDVMDNKCKQC